jgi:site-specific DNA-cytosine methylase
MKRLLELFSGTGSVRKAVGEQFDEVISIDILNKFQPTEVCDILQWNYKKYPPGYFHTIWASPPCTEYSKVLYCRPGRQRNLNMANAIVKRTIEIISYFNPERWFIENPQTGLLKEQDFMLGIPFVDVDYCKYGYQYRKRTRIWTNIDYIGKVCKKDCGMMINNHHILSTGLSKFKNDKASIPSLETRYSIPSQLIIEMFNCV